MPCCNDCGYGPCCGCSCAACIPCYMLRNGWIHTNTDCLRANGLQDDCVMKCWNKWR